jgi:F-type H+-transporting ATPase subunit b
MDINLTLLGQMITFILFIWFTLRYVWPPLSKAMEERKQKIAEGIVAAEQSQRELELAKHKALEILREAKLKASHTVEQANHRSLHMIEEAKEAARQESLRITAQAQVDIEHQYQQAKRELTSLIGTLSVDVARKMIQQDVDVKTHQRLLDDLLSEI